MTLGRRIEFLIVWTIASALLAACEQDSKCCSCLEMEGKSDKYDYPIVPGTPEWAALKTEEEIYNACQIPNDILADMCEIGLVDSWLTYPLRSNIFTWPTPQLGFEQITENFNGLNQLLTRPSSQILLKKYKLYDPSGYDPNDSNVEIGKYTVDLLILELTLSQFMIIDKLSPSQRIELVDEALSKRTLKLADPVYHGTTDPDVLYHSGDVYIMAHCMVHSDYEPFMTELAKNNDALKHFVETGQYVFPTGSTTPAADLMTIVNHAKGFIGN